MPLEVVYTSASQPVVYEDMSISLCVSGYVMVMTGWGGEKDQVKPYMIQHLQELMEDADSYGWEPAREYHAIWLQQME